MSKNYIHCNGEKHYPLDYQRVILAEALDANDPSEATRKDKCVVLEVKTLDGELIKTMLRACDATHLMFDLLYVLTKGESLCKECASKHWEQVREALVGLIKARMDNERHGRDDEDQSYERN